jgi:hypothetical protein
MIGTIKVSQIPPAGLISGEDNLIVNQSGSTRLTTVDEVVGIITYVNASGISTFSGYADTAGIATYADFAGIATYADTAGISTFSGYADTAGIATYADFAGIATYADTAGIATFSGYADNAGVSTYADFAGIATYADTAGIATYADTSGVSTFSGYADTSGIATFSGYADTAGISTFSGYADTSGIATYAINAGIATYADFAGVSTFSGYADTAGIATYADTAGISTFSGYADNAGVSTYAINAGIATYADTAGISTFSGYADTAGIATYADTAGIATYAINAGIATYADTAGIATYADFAGVSTFSGYADTAGIATYADTAGISTFSGYADTAGIATYADVSGISTVSQGLTGNPDISVSSLNVSGVSTLGNVQVFSGIVTATSGIVTYYGDGSKLQNIISGVGIQSSGTIIGSDITTLNFIGAGNTFSVDGSTVDISIQGGGGSQWIASSSGIHTTSNVGIGTTNPIHPFQVGSAGTSVVVITDIGSVGIGTTNPTSKLQVVGDINLDDGGSFVTTLQTVTATANRTISFPDDTGTIALVSGSTGQVTYNDAGANAGGNLVYDKTAGTFGYGAGGGTVTQATNKTTGVTLSTSCGTIVMNGAALAADTTATFVLTNTSIAATDMVLVSHSSVGTFGAYTLNGRAAAGSASIDVRNVSTGSLSEAIVIRFAVIKSTIT